MQKDPSTRTLSIPYIISIKAEQHEKKDEFNVIVHVDASGLFGTFFNFHVPIKNKQKKI